MYDYQAILCTKEIGVKARAAAYELIIAMSDTYIRWHPDIPEKGKGVLRLAVEKVFWLN